MRGLASLSRSDTVPLVGPSTSLALAKPFLYPETPKLPRGLLLVSTTAWG